MVKLAKYLASAYKPSLNSQWLKINKICYLVYAGNMPSFGCAHRGGGRNHSGKVGWVQIHLVPWLSELVETRPMGPIRWLCLCPTAPTNDVL